MADLENLRRKLAGLGSLLSRSAAEEAFDSPGIAMAVSVSPPRSRGASRPRAPAAAAAHPSPPARHFHSTVRAGPPLGASNVRDAPLGGLLAKMKDAEAAWLKEKGKLVMANKAEAARRQKAEAELRRVGEQLAYSRGEAKHLKEALRGRDGQLAELADRLREYELAEGGERTAAETVRQAQEERDELRAAMADLLARLDAANGVIAGADASMASAEAAVAAAREDQRRAEEAAAAARAKAAAAREEVAELQFKCGLLQQLADLTMKSNDERTATLRALLDSESMLDAEAGGGAGVPAAGGGGDELSDGGSSLC